MSSGAPSSGATAALVVIFFIFLIILRRAYNAYRGIRFSFARTVGFAVFYVGYAAFFAIPTFVGGVSVFYALPDALVLLLAALWSYRHSDKRITFWRPSDGAIRFRGGIIVYLVYVGALAARLATELYFVGPEMFSFSTSVTVFQGNALYAMIVTDLLLFLGAGLLLGRNLRVLKRYKAMERTGELEKLPVDAVQR